MSGIRYLIDDLDCLESCNSIPMSSVAAGPGLGPGAAASADFGLSSGAYTAFDGAAAMGGGALAAAGQVDEFIYFLG